MRRKAPLHFLGDGGAFAFSLTNELEHRSDFVQDNPDLHVHTVARAKLQPVCLEALVDIDQLPARGIIAPQAYLGGAHIVPFLLARNGRFNRIKLSTVVNVLTPI